MIRPLTVTKAVYKLPRWQQHALHPRMILNQHIRHKSSIPAMQRLDDDDDYDSDDDVEVFKKADWFDRAINLKPTDGHLRLKKQRKGATFANLVAEQEKFTMPMFNDESEFSLGLSVYDDAESKERPVRLGDMTTEEVDEWLDGFEIPEEAFKLNKTPQEVRHLYAKQLRLEQAVYALSLEKNQDTIASVNSVRRGSETSNAKSYINKWTKPMSKAIKELGDKYKQPNRASTKSPHFVEDLGMYGPVLYLLDPDELAQIAITTTMNHVLMEEDGVKFVKITLAIAKEIQDMLLAKAKDFEKLDRLLKKKKAMAGKSEFDDAMSNKKMIYFQTIRRNLTSKDAEDAERLFATAGKWSKEFQLKLGSGLLELLEQNCYADGRAELGDMLTSPEHAASHFSDDEPTSIVRVKAFEHAVRYENSRRYGIIRCTKPMYEKIMKGDIFLPWCARYLPMVVPPKPWNGIENGGYLTLPTKIMRLRNDKWQLKCVASGEMDDLVRSLNMLADIPWVINREVFDVVMKLWENGGDFGDLPPRADMPMPEEPLMENYMHIDDGLEREAKFAADVDQYKKNLRKVEKKNREYNSLRCDTVYKLQVAEEFQHEEAIYFPYNMDFRGRVYPIPPNLNHLGSDMSRSLLIFKDKKPLGDRGLYWLKVHLAGLFGIDKCSFDDRVKFVDENMDNILASAANPLGESDDCRWWMQAEAPFLTLGVVFDLARAVQHPNPAEYMSNIPVHMDGSCNGLQHYAALGRDQAGAEQVNLVGADKPQDVYTGVATRVIERMEFDAYPGERSHAEWVKIARARFQDKWVQHQRDLDVFNRENPKYLKEFAKLTAYLALKDQLTSAENPKPRMPYPKPSVVKKPRHVENLTESEFYDKEAEKLAAMAPRNRELAEMLLTAISRKVVKQTVMTSVYGVTTIGARKQIMARLEDIFLLQGKDVDEELEAKIYQAAKYTSELTMDSMKDLFSSARHIMNWLAECTHHVTEEGQPMSWITPLGLPVTQPYCQATSKQVRTSKQAVILSVPDLGKVSAGRQKSAFPPNYVHSLDSTHMMMTALKVIGEDKLEFAAVHDSYWTHACAVDCMNSRLRDEFVALYSQPLLEDLLMQLQLRFPNQTFPPIPQLGQLDLKEVLKSPYFFN
ncbi:Aste57867_22383 [Aphanomyces stellatus]|uniref:DNA-directed RNA polymerase n=1 Tax=Aphanomyces stellatus TaxID=120398 RepID=A0A485LK76_9STRA|nr:hypothetical protein As57867_022313 [Aphanomyces stellatus]VFT99046.1 Aste57867_22383 [Aphanomyces stellatus]